MQKVVAAFPTLCHYLYVSIIRCKLVSKVQLIRIRHCSQYNNKLVSVVRLCCLGPAPASYILFLPLKSVTSWLLPNIRATVFA